MYGLVNRAIEQHVCCAHGRAMWERIRAEAGCDVEGFVSNQPYPDSITYDLVGAASKVSGRPVEEVLEAFGEFWVLHTGLESYGALMRSGGRNVREFLLKLPDFHTRVQLIFPKLQPPDFSCSDVQEDSLLLHYRTHRLGLEPFVDGLLQGIGKMFNTPVSVQLVADRRHGADHSVFRIRWGSAGR